MPAITITDLNNAKLDVDHIAEIATSTSNTSIDRLGATKNTIYRAMSLIDSNVEAVDDRVAVALAVDIPAAIASLSVMNNRGAWVSSTAYTYRDTVSYSGTWYVCVVPHTSSGAFATDTATKWRIYQGVTTGDLSASSGAGLVGYDVTDYYSPGTIGKKLQDVVSVVDFGATGDGTTDDTTAFQNAVNYSRHVIVPKPLVSYRLIAPLILSSYGQQLIGLGSKGEVVLTIDHVAGAGVVVQSGQCTLSNMTIAASDTRQSAGGSYALVSGLFGVHVDSSVSASTQCLFDRLAITRHPNHGFYMGKGGLGTIINQCEVSYNRGHGYAFDDGTIAGGSTSRCGIVNLNSCRAMDNGGNAVHISQVGSTCYRFDINNLETIWNAWNTSIVALNNTEVYLAGENHRISMSAVADPDGDTRTVMGNGDARLVKTVLSRGIYIRTGSNNIQLENIRYNSTSMGVETGTGILYLSVLGAYFTQQEVSSGLVNQLYGFKIGDGYEGLYVRIPNTSLVDVILDSDTAGGQLFVGSTEYYVYGEQVPGLSGTLVKQNGYDSATIAAGSLNASSRYMNMGATSATDLLAVARAGGSNLLPAAMVFHLVNTSAYVITVKHGTAALSYIRTKSGGDVTLNPGQSISLVTDSNGSPHEM